MTGFLAGMAVLVVLAVILCSGDRGTHLSRRAARRAQRAARARSR